jgi:N-acetyl-anhydromuramyl-L-alanine amidase AmpD
MNETGIGICLVGDFEKGRPTAAQKASLHRLIAFLTEYCRIAPERVLVHRDVRSTNCPGKNFPYREFLAGKRLVPADSRP